MPKYAVRLQPQALRDLEELPERDARRLESRIARLENDLAGDVKKLRNYTPGYRLRVGDWRVLFDVVGTDVIVFRILNRRDAYD